MVNILVVDDEPTIRRLLRLTLGPKHRVEEAADGQEALNKMRLNIPDVVLLDIAMPRMDGLSVCRAVREDAALRTISIIVVSAHASRSEALDAGADYYLQKPFRPLELLVAIDNLLEFRKKKIVDPALDPAQIDGR
jgi:CheY-like chemotaxis protein